MRRWNGWGDSQQDFPLPPAAKDHLAKVVGPGQPHPDASLESVLRSLPSSRFPAHPLVTTDPHERLRHARGQSLPDWIALRSGAIENFPDAIAYPESEEALQDLITLARDQNACLIPYGGGTSVVGHVNPTPSDRPCLTVDMSHLDRLISLDEASRLATFEAGIAGPALERCLRQLGYTLGHFPQSFEFSTLGGWIATRSTGQQSYYYGRIEDLFAGGQVETPVGTLHLPPFPASAAGPDLRQIVLGSEGRLGIISRATVRIRPRPRDERFVGIFFRHWEEGVAAVQAMAQSGVGASMIRLSDPVETQTTLALADPGRLTSTGLRGLAWLGYGEGRVVCIIGWTDEHGRRSEPRRACLSIARAHGGLNLGRLVGHQWEKSRFTTPYLRNTLWEEGYALDTLETALPWKNAVPLAPVLRTALAKGLEQEGERVLAFVHLSHVYSDGASLYATYLFRRHREPSGTLERWRRLKGLASDKILSQGGTISHQHGVGLDHRSYLEQEKGQVGMAALRAILATVDPRAIMNPGKLA